MVREAGYERNHSPRKFKRTVFTTTAELLLNKHVRQSTSLDTAIMGSDPTLDMDVCFRLSVF
jgi:hypothetical protein